MAVALGIVSGLRLNELMEAAKVVHLRGRRPWLTGGMRGAKTSHSPSCPLQTLARHSDVFCPGHLLPGVGGRYPPFGTCSAEAKSHPYRLRAQVHPSPPAFEIQVHLLPQYGLVSWGHEGRQEDGGRQKEETGAGLTCVLLIPSSRSRVTSACRSNSVWATRSSCSAWEGRGMSARTRTAPQLPSHRLLPRP